MITVSPVLYNWTKRNQCRCQKRTLQIAFVAAYQKQITDLWHLSSAKTLLVLPKTGEILFKFRFAEDTAHFYHFIGPFTDGQRSIHTWQNLKAFRKDELKKQKMDAEEPNQSTQTWHCL